MTSYSFHGEISGPGNVFGPDGRTENTINNHCGAHEITSLIDKLIHEIEAHKAELGQADEMLEQATEIRAYAGSPRFNVQGARRLLSALTAGAGGVTAVALAVEQVTRVIESL
jgi:hypothetical protein